MHGPLYSPSPPTLGKPSSLKNSCASRPEHRLVCRSHPTSAEPYTEPYTRRLTGEVLLITFIATVAGPCSMALTNPHNVAWQYGTVSGHAVMMWPVLYCSSLSPDWLNKGLRGSHVDADRPSQAKGIPSSVNCKLNTGGLHSVQSLYWVTLFGQTNDMCLGSQLHVQHGPKRGHLTFTCRAEWPMQPVFHELERMPAFARMANLSFRIRRDLPLYVQTWEDTIPGLAAYC